jgi:thiol:disulfide interchange protein DsbA
MRKFIIAIMLSALFFTPALADDKIKGKYEVVGSLDKLKGAKQIDMVEFFNYSCGHCYRFLTESKRLEKKFKGKLLHKKYPIYWQGKQSPYPAMAYYIADEQGVEKKFTQAMFDTHFQMNIDMFQPRNIRMLSTEFGIEKEMTQGFQSKDIKAKVDKSLGMATQANANETPTIIINGVLKVTPSMVGGSTDKMTDNLEVIFDDILGK